MADVEQKQDNRSSLFSLILAKLTDTNFLLTIIGLLVVVGIGLAIYFASNVTSTEIANGSPGLFESLRNTETARGLITFLVAITTVAIAIILSLFAVVSSGPDYKERFSLGKEILTLLIGVLGTILGFYFGLAGDGKDRDVSKSVAVTAQALQIPQPYVSGEIISKGKPLKVMTFVSGGQPPYQYAITSYPPDAIQPIKEKKSETGLIDADLTLQDSVKPETTEVTYQIEITDSAGKKAIFDKERTKKIIVK